MTSLKLIKEGNYEKKELEEFLKYSNPFVLSNTMKEIVKHKYINERIKKRLIEISEFKDKRNVLMGIYTSGHLAVATLIKLGYIKKTLDCYTQLDEYDKDIVDKLVEGYDSVL